MAERVDRGTASPDCNEPNQNGTVGVILVNYCTLDLTVQCLSSLKAEIASLPGSRVIVVDNASPDGSGPKIAEAIAAHGWSNWATLLAQPVNGGFSYGNNAAMRVFLAQPAPPMHFWLLNTDTVVREGALRALVAFMQRNPSVGISGSQLEHPDTRVQSSAFRFHSIAGELESNLHVGIVSRLLGPWVIAPAQPKRPAPYDWVSGASMLIRRQVVEDIGLLDENYFLYYEETDFCRRARTSGWACWFVPESRVVHFVGQSTGVTNHAMRTKRRPAYWFQSRRRYFIKHHGVVYAALADAALAAATMLVLLRDRLLGRERSSPDNFLWDLLQQSAARNPQLGKN